MQASEPRTEEKGPGEILSGRPGAPTAWLLPGRSGIPEAAGLSLGIPDRANQQRRSRFDICFDVLWEVGAQGEARPTVLMFKTNLCWRSLWETLGFLLERGLVSYRRVGARRTVALTPLGRTCLQRLHEARSLLEAEPMARQAPVPRF